MNAETLKALQASIATWERRARGSIYLVAQIVVPCVACLLMATAKTVLSNRERGTVGVSTAYARHFIWSILDEQAAAKRPKIKVDAQAEVDFLKSLLLSGQSEAAAVKAELTRRADL